MALYEPEIEKTAKREEKDASSAIPRRLGFETGIPVERLLEAKVRQVCADEQIDYLGLEPIQRLFLTHYRCPICKLLPLYYLDLTYPKRVRCHKCGQLICFRGNGKWGRIRKKVAFELMPTIRR
ncbi:MAG: hypothetical protein ABI361_05330 [Nitrososphaera sp.]|jgi:hypothetical protein